jgi:hypothetical protein
MEAPSNRLILVLSLSKDGLHTSTPWFDKLTTGLAQAVSKTPQTEDPFQ